MTHTRIPTLSDSRYKIVEITATSIDHIYGAAYPMSAKDLAYISPETALACIDTKEPVTLVSYNLPDSFTRSVYYSRLMDWVGVESGAAATPTVPAATDTYIPTLDDFVHAYKFMQITSISHTHLSMEERVEKLIAGHYSHIAYECRNWLDLTNSIDSIEDKEGN